MTLSFEQFGALQMFCKNDFMLLLGYAGAGKTSSLNTILTMCDDNGLTYTLFSPTGSASLRMTEATNRPASTIHRPYYREQKFDTDVIVVDEYSMVDVEVCNMLISMIENPNAKIIFATTTKIIEEDAPKDWERRNQEIELYNKKAKELMLKLGVEINDLFAITNKFDKTHYADWTHPNEKGAEILAQAIVEKII
jgi:ATP-dependent exoDNAse (exonuclease V) alpha subunit